MNSAHRDAASLCHHCEHMRRVESSHGSVFILCELSRRDPNFPKYPRLPVLRCPGFQRAREKTGGDDVPR